MTIQQIVDEQMREFDEKLKELRSNDWVHAATDWGHVKSFIQAYTRTLINDWEKKAREYVLGKSQSGTYDLAGDIETEILDLTNLLADARREVIDNIQGRLDLAKDEVEMADDPEDPKVRIKYFEHVLATLRKETK